MVGAGVGTTSGPARWTLVLVGAHTGFTELARTLRRSGTRVVCVLVDSIRATVVVLHHRATTRRITRGLGTATAAVGVAAVAWLVVSLPVLLAVATWYLGETWLPARGPIGGGHSGVAAGWLTAYSPLLFGAGCALAARLSGG